MTDIDKPVDPNRTRNNIFIIAGTVVVIATYLYLILAQPAAVGEGLSGGTPALITLAGYVIGALLIAVGAINRLPTTTVVLVPVAIAINITVGQSTAALGLPLYLDSIGTILVAVVAGPAAGAVTGGLSNVIWGLTLSPLALPFAIVAIIIGALAGWAARIGVFRTYWAPPLAGIVVGQITSALGLPLYLDSIGTILVAVVAGPAAGAVTGGLSNVIWGLTLSPLALPFAIVAIVIGVVAGWAARIGVFRSYWAPPIAGIITGIIAALASSPISAFIFGGATGGGTGAIVAAFQAFGNSLLASTTLQGLLSDPLDKLITFTVVMLILLALPTRFKQRFPFVRQYNVLPGMTKKDKAAA